MIPIVAIAGFDPMQRGYAERLARPGGNMTGFALISDEIAAKQGEDMRPAQRLLAAAVASIVGKSEERALASLFSPGGTHALKGEFAGINDFEVVAFLAVLA